MKIAIPSRGQSVDAPVDERFGRCACFALTEDDGASWTIRENPCLQSPGGAGVQAAQFLDQEGVDILLVDNLGPKAAQVIQAAGIEIHTGIQGTVEQALRDYQEQKLKPVQAAGAPEAPGRQQRGRVRGGREK